MSGEVKREPIEEIKAYIDMPQDSDVMDAVITLERKLKIAEEAFEKEYPECMKYCIFENGEFHGGKIGSHPSTVGFWNGKYKEFKSGYISRNAEIEAPKFQLLAKEQDDILIQENQSLKEQIKILIHIAYPNRDFPMGDYIHDLGTEDYQTYVANNEKEFVAEIEALKYQLEGFKDQYNTDEKTIASLKAEIELMRCCGNCGNRKNRICNIKSEIPLGEDVCNNWTRRTK